jgi:hypothetical protein
MKKLLLLFLLGSSFNGMAQVDQSVDNYIFRYKTGQPYVALTGATNHTAGRIWAENITQIPIGFTSKIGDKTAENFICFGNGFGAFALASDTNGVINRFMPIGWDGGVCDRGVKSGIPKSPIRFQIDGVSPNRIFKVEMFNTGFFHDCLFNGAQDSLNIQFWIYETSNIIEIRFGSRFLMNPSPYPYIGAIGVPVFGYIKDDSISTIKGVTRSYKFAKGYNLTGNPNAPLVDSFYNYSSPIPGLTSYPDSGTVYRFIPKTVATSFDESTIAAKFQVYPTITTDNIIVMADNVVATSGRIIDLNGNVESIIQNIENGKNTIDVSSFASGNYVLEIANAEGKGVYKFTKQ